MDPFGLNTYHIFKTCHFDVNNYEENAAINQRVPNKDWCFEYEMYFELEKDGYINISKYKGNGIFMNPDMYKIVNGKIQSIEVKNNIPLGRELDCIKQTFLNGLWANESILIFKGGNIDKLKKHAAYLGVGLIKFKQGVMVEPISRVLSNDIIKEYSSNWGIYSSIEENNRH